MACFDFIPEKFEKMFDAPLRFLLGVNVGSTIVFGWFAVLYLVDFFVDSLYASMEGRAS